MVKFIDLNSEEIQRDSCLLYNGDFGYIDAEANTVTGNGYIHKFPAEQSTGLIYTHSIGIVSDVRTITVTIENNNIFKLIDMVKFNSDGGFDNMDNLEKINGISYLKLSKYAVDKLTIQGTQTYDNLYFYPVYFLASSEVAGEFRAQFSIDVNPHVIYKIGADFYDENESLKINLSNFGVELPEAILKSLYTTNVREDKTDYITLNRKLKELLSNYWSVIANRGSYKSLINSLKWFEYGDILKLKEYWGRNDFGHTMYQCQDISMVMASKYEDFLKFHYKTSYLSLNLALKQFAKKEGKLQYDKEKNPLLEKISSEWSINDLALKVSMLGNFYETYFMPIHLNLIQSTIEDVVFTNTMKIINGVALTREDKFNSFLPIKCNVKPDDVFYITNVDTAVSINTKMVWRSFMMPHMMPIYNPDVPDASYIDSIYNWTKYSDRFITYYGEPDYNSKVREWTEDMKKHEQYMSEHPDEPTRTVPGPHTPNYSNTPYFIGVDDMVDMIEIEDGKYKHDMPVMKPGSTDEQYIKSFFSHHYSGPGVVVKFQCELLMEPEDYIKRENISFIPDFSSQNRWITKEIHDIYSKRKIIETVDENGNSKQIETQLVEMNFNMLCREPRKHEIRLMCEAASGRIYTKVIKFEVKESVNNILKLYKVLHNDYPTSDGFNNVPTNGMNHIVFGIQKNLDLTSPIYNFEVPIYVGGIDVSKWKGVCLNNILVITSDVYYGDAGKDETFPTPEEKMKEYLKHNYIMFKKTIKTEGKPNRYHTVCVSKKFWFSPDILNLNKVLSKYNNGVIYRNDYGYFPEFHHLKEFGGLNYYDNVITDRDAICVKPEFHYGAKIKDVEWTFVNASTGKVIKLPNSINEPFIANDYKSTLTPGYYDVILRFSLVNEDTVREMRLDSAFIKQ